jgi:hypothetical protein
LGGNLFCTEIKQSDAGDLFDGAGCVLLGKSTPFDNLVEKLATRYPANNYGM